MQVRIRFVIYGFIAPKVNTPKCTYVIHITQFKCTQPNLRNFKNAHTRKSSNLQVGFKRPYKKPQYSKTLYIVAKMSPVTYKKAGTFFLPFTFNKAKKNFKVSFFLTLSLPAQECVPALQPSLSLVCACKIKCLCCNNSFNLNVFVARKSCTKILFHVVV